MTKEILEQELKSIATRLDIQRGTLRDAKAAVTHALTTRDKEAIADARAKLDAIESERITLKNKYYQKNAELSELIHGAGALQ